MLAKMDAAPDQALVIADAFRQTDRITRAHSKTFHLATALLPHDARRAIRALYAFCRASDDLVDRDGATLQEVERWRAAAAGSWRAQHDPILLCWALIREQYGVDPKYQNELIDGIAVDLRRRSYATWAELERYCYLVASTVGLLAMPILGPARGVRFEAAAPYAIRLGLALQLTNILRDVGEDASRGRVYLPQSDLARFGLTGDDILQGIYDERFIALMRFEIARARELYAAALPGIALLSPAGRPAVGAAALLYRAILDRIEAIGYRVHAQRAQVSGLRKLLMLPGVIWRVLALRRPGPCALPAGTAIVRGGQP